MVLFSLYVIGYLICSNYDLVTGLHFIIISSILVYFLRIPFYKVLTKITTLSLLLYSAWILVSTLLERYNLINLNDNFWIYEMLIIFVFSFFYIYKIPVNTEKYNNKYIAKIYTKPKTIKQLFYFILSQPYYLVVNDNIYWFSNNSKTLSSKKYSGQLVVHTDIKSTKKAVNFLESYDQKWGLKNNCLTLLKDIKNG